MLSAAIPQNIDRNNSILTNLNREGFPKGSPKILLFDSILISFSFNLVSFRTQFQDSRQAPSVYKEVHSEVQDDHILYGKAPSDDLPPL